MKSIVYNIYCYNTFYHLFSFIQMSQSTDTIDTTIEHAMSCPNHNVVSGYTMTISFILLSNNSNI